MFSLVLTCSASTFALDRFMAEDQADQGKCIESIRDPAGYSDVQVHINDYLNALPCADTISTNLTAIFEDSPEGKERRDALEKNLDLKRLCSRFVDALSVLATTESLITVICDDGGETLSDEVETTVFCTRLDVTSEGDAGTTSKLVKTEFPDLADEVSDLANGCPSSCGEGDGQVLCNSFFSLARLLGDKYQEGESEF